MKKILPIGLLAISLIFLAGCIRTVNNGGSQKPEEKQDSTDNTSGQNETNSQNYTISENDIVLFWGEGCPHCVNVENFLAENEELNDKLKIRKMEVFNDAKGQNIFMEKVKECGLDGPGVPTLYTKGKCTQGDTPIIEELKKMK